MAKPSTASAVATRTRPGSSGRRPLASRSTRASPRRHCDSPRRAAHAEQRDRDADRAEHDVLPGCFERASRAVVPDEEGGGDRRGLDGNPENAEVVGQDRERHGAEEHAAPRGIAPLGAVAAYPGRVAGEAAPGRGQPDGTDHGEHERRQRVGAQAHRGWDPRPVDEQRQPASRGSRSRPRRRTTGTPAAAFQGRGRGGEQQRREQGDDEQRETASHQSRSSVSRRRGRAEQRASAPTAPRGSAPRAARRARPPARPTNGTPAEVRNATVAIPLSRTRKPTSWDSARRRVTSSRNPTRTIVIPTGTARQPVRPRAARPPVAS